jgi:hypothetical protein
MRRLARRSVIIGSAAMALMMPAQPGHAQLGPKPLDDASPGTLCAEAVHAAELRYHLPPRLLFAISLVEAGRPDATLHKVEPWPWTVQAAGDGGLYFDSKRQAVQWVKDAMARGLTSIDTGCMQVNLYFHPRAFETIDAAFDPRSNADYAARFLLQLHASTGDWQQAVGFYHSQTRSLAEPYAARVDQVLHGSVGGWSAPPKPPSLLSQLARAWRATLGGGKPDAGDRNPD